MSSPLPSDPQGLRGGDWLLLVALCAMLYGVAAFSGRPLSVHEARLPQLSREIAQGQSDWLLPQSAGRPWLERPPLPHWCTAISMMLFARSDALWSARLPAALAGCAIVLCGAWMASRWFGRRIGLLSGVVIATSYELYRYATLAEDDIYLGMVVAACMTLFVRAQWPAKEVPVASDRNPLTAFFSVKRSWTVAGFFLLLGLTNFAKGPLVGALPVLGTIAVFLIWNRERRSIVRYAWLWGWLIFVALTVFWPWWAQRSYPDIWDNWRYDYFGQGGGDAAKKWNEPVWYYLSMLPLALAPWTWATVIGFIATAARARRSRGSPERFLWCWALMSLVVLSLPARKHHHYLVPVIVPWAILGALGLQAVARFFEERKARETSVEPKPSLHPGWLVGAGVAVFVVIAGWVQLTRDGRDEATLAELKFLEKVMTAVPDGNPVYINSDISSLGFFRLQFTLGRWHELIHNLSFLRDREIDYPVVYVITRSKDFAELQRLGSTGSIAQVAASRRQKSADERFTLFRVKLAPDLARFPKPGQVGVMQAMGRRRGPWCGEEWSPSHVNAD